MKKNLKIFILLCFLFFLFQTLNKTVVASENCTKFNGAYQDTDDFPPNQPICSNHGPFSAKQMRRYDKFYDAGYGGYVCRCSSGGQWDWVDFDSDITSVSVNGVTSGDVPVASGGNINLEVKIRNTGYSNSGSWYSGIKIKLEGGRTDSKNCRASGDYFGNTPDTCPDIPGAGCDWTEQNEDWQLNGAESVSGGETITITCSIPVSGLGWYPLTGSERIKFYIDESDTGQGSYTLAEKNPAEVRVKDSGLSVLSSTIQNTLILVIAIVIVFTVFKFFTRKKSNNTSSSTNKESF